MSYKPLKTLENELGYTLFLRGKGQRKIILTDEGRQFFGLATEYRNIVEEMFKIGKQKEYLRISTIDSIGTFILPQTYEKFMEECTDVVLEIQDLDTKGSYENVSKGFTDLAFATSIRDFPRVELKSVYSEKMVLVCSKSNDFGDVVALEELNVKNEVFIFWDENFADWHRRNLGNLENVRIRVELMSHLEYFLQKNNSWAIVPVSVAKGLTVSQKAVIKAVDFECPGRVAYCCAVSDNPKKKIMDKFVACLKSTIADLNEEGIELLI